MDLPIILYKGQEDRKAPFRSLYRATIKNRRRMSTWEKTKTKR